MSKLKLWQRKCRQVSTIYSCWEKKTVSPTWITLQMLSQLQYHIYHETVFKKVVVGHMRRKNRLSTESTATMQTNNKSLQYFTLCMLTTRYLLTAALSPAPLHDCQSPKNLIYHIQNSTGEEAAPPLLKVSPTPPLSNRSQAQSSSVSSWLPGPVSSLSVQKRRLQRQKAQAPFWGSQWEEALVTKQSKRFPSSARKSDHQKLEQSSTGCPETLMNLYLRGFS